MITAVEKSMLSLPSANVSPIIKRKEEEEKALLSLEKEKEEERKKRTRNSVSVDYVCITKFKNTNI